MMLSNSRIIDIGKNDIILKLIETVEELGGINCIFIESIIKQFERLSEFELFNDLIRKVC